MSAVFPETLWGVLLSTNQCYPGCFCDDDVFELVQHLKPPWSHDFDDEDLAQARNELQALLEEKEFSVVAFSQKLSTNFTSSQQIRDFLEAFALLLEGKQPEQPKSLQGLEMRVRFEVPISEARKLDSSRLP